MIIGSDGPLLWHAGSQLQHATFRAHRFSSCYTQFFLVAPWMWILDPQPGIKPTPPALKGRFLTTGPSGKSQGFFF